MTGAMTRTSRPTPPPGSSRGSATSRACSRGPASIRIGSGADEAAQLAAAAPAISTVVVGAARAGKGRRAGHGAGRRLGGGDAGGCPQRLVVTPGGVDHGGGCAWLRSSCSGGRPGRRGHGVAPRSARHLRHGARTWDAGQLTGQLTRLRADLSLRLPGAAVRRPRRARPGRVGRARAPERPSADHAHRLCRLRRAARAGGAGEGARAGRSRARADLPG